MGIARRLDRRWRIGGVLRWLGGCAGASARALFAVALAFLVSALQWGL